MTKIEMSLDEKVKNDKKTTSAYHIKINEHNYTLYFSSIYNQILECNLNCKSLFKLLKT